MNNPIPFGYNFNYANFANVGITRTWGIFKNDYDVKNALNRSNKFADQKQKVRKQKLAINILSNAAQYIIINLVMLKLDKQVNRNTLIAVSVPFLINALIDIVTRTNSGQKIADKLALNKDPIAQLEPVDIQKFDIVDIKPLSSKFDPVLEDFLNKKKDNISFDGVSYTNVHILGKLVNKLRGAFSQTYDVYSAGKQIDLPQDQLLQTTSLKFMREMSSQLIENIVYFGILLKLRKQIDKNLALAVFLPAAMTIAFDLLSRSNIFKFLDDWSKSLFKNKNLEMIENSQKLGHEPFNSVKGYKYYIDRKYGYTTKNK